MRMITRDEQGNELEIMLPADYHFMSYVEQVAAIEKAAAEATVTDRERFIGLGGDPDILGVCKNCGQWVRKSNRNDCTHQCRTRGFA